jgi:hypothetical protein
MTEEETPAEVAAFVPTSAEDYPTTKKEIEATLPSGAKVIVRRPSKYELMRTGGFPKDVEAAIRDSARDRTELDFDVRVKIIDHLLVRAFVDPKAHITPKKGHVCIYDLPDSDREWLVVVLGLTSF